MTRSEKIIRGCALLGTLCLLYSAIDRIVKHPVHAMEFQEVQPYKFADIVDKDPWGGERHADIYKGVHEGCEFYIVHQYHFETKYSDAISNSIALGRGCK
jgi:hypothetical protein